MLALQIKLERYTNKYLKIVLNFHKKINNLPDKLLGLFTNIQGSI